jgi:hypothetical protein
LHPDRGSHVLFSMVGWREGELLLQYEVRREDREADSHAPMTIDSRIIDLATGDVLAKSTALPPVLGGDADWLVILGQEAYPQALLVERLQ